MEPLLAIVVAIGAIVLVLAIFLRFRRGGEDMIARQKRKIIAALERAPSGPREVAPDTARSDVEALLAVPDIRDALQKGRKVETIRLVRERAGIGLKEAKELVERATRR